MNKLSIVIPVYNEEKLLEELSASIQDTLEAAGISYEVILVDDGSTDRSWSLIAGLCAQHAAFRGVKLSSNVGQHNAIMAGFSHVEGQLVITIDADLQDSPTVLPLIYKRLESGFDIVGCKRKLRKDSILRRCLSALMNFTIRHFSRLRNTSSGELTDFGCMLRGYRRWVVDRLLESGGKSIYIPTFAAAIGGRFCEIEIEHESRKQGTSKYGIRTLIDLYFDMITDISLFPIQFISAMGIGLSLVGFILGIVIFIRRIFIGPEVEGVFTLFAFLFIFAGVLLVSVGLIGEYVGRIYREVNRAPRFIVRERAGFRKGLRIGVFAYSEVGYVCLKRLLEAGERVVFVVTHTDSKDEHIWFRSVAELAHAHSIPVLEPSDINARKFIEAIASFSPDVIFSFYFRKIFSKELLNIPPKGCINLHGSLLPRYRGRAPVNWVLLNGETETGVTLHFMTEKVDAGAIVAQQRIAIQPDEDALSLTKKIATVGATLLMKLVSILHQGKPKAIAQDEAKATYFGKRTPEMGAIDWSWSERKIHNYVRALSDPFPGAFFSCRERTCIITKGQPATCPSAQENDAKGELQLDETLVKFGEIPREIRMKFLSKEFIVPSISLNDVVPDPALATLINESLARRYGIFPVKAQKKVLLLAMSHPNDIHAIEDISLITGMDILPRAAPPEEITRLLDEFYSDAARQGETAGALHVDARTAQPGTIVQLAEDGMLVKTGSGCFRILELLVEGKRYTPRAFSRMLGLAVGGSCAG